MKIALIGPPGSGKGTQVELLEEELGIPALNVGDLLYFGSQEKDELAGQIKEIMDSGEVVDDEIVARLVEEHLATPSFQKGFILDGFPRRLNQPKMLKTRPDRVIYLDVSDKESTKRLLKRGKKEGRKDDKPEIIKKRLKLYHQETKPLLDYYRERGILEEVDGQRPIEVIFEDILGRLENLT